VSKTRRGQTYKFNIVNLIKPDSLYNNGMKPLMYSKKTADQKGTGWHRCGNDIKYYPSKRRLGVQATQMFTLSFTVDMPYDSD